MTSDPERESALLTPSAWAWVLLGGLGVGAWMGAALPADAQQDRPAAAGVITEGSRPCRPAPETAGPPRRVGLPAASPLIDINQAPQADLESVPGIGPALSERLLAERRQRVFVDWYDLAARIRGIGWHGAVRLSRGGLRIEGCAHPDDRNAPWLQ